MRLFIALDPPQAVRDALTELYEPIRDLRWTRPEQLHVTMRFLGEVAPEAEERLIGRLAAIRVEPFLLPVEGVGAFPPKRPPHVLWAGIGSGHPRLFQLRQRIDDAILAAGIDADMRTFHAHITLARCGPAAARPAAEWQKRHATFAAPSFRVTSFNLYSSHPSPEGSTYTPEATFPLHKGPGR